MSKFMCKCGYSMDFSRSPADAEWNLVRESVISDIGVRLDEGEELSGDDFFNLIDDGGVDVLRCQNCGRLWLFDTESKSYFAYVREQNLNEEGHTGKGGV